jgi:hypothetical protein
MSIIEMGLPELPPEHFWRVVGGPTRYQNSFVFEQTATAVQILEKYTKREKQFRVLFGLFDIPNGYADVEHEYLHISRPIQDRDGKPILTEFLTSEIIQKAAVETLAEWRRAQQAKELLGNYPPKRLLPVVTDDTEEGLKQYLYLLYMQNLGPEHGFYANQVDRDGLLAIFNAGLGAGTP